MKFHPIVTCVILSFVFVESGWSHPIQQEEKDLQELSLEVFFRLRSDGSKLEIYKKPDGQYVSVRSKNYDLGFDRFTKFEGQLSLFQCKETPAELDLSEAQTNKFKKIVSKMAKGSKSINQQRISSPSVIKRKWQPFGLNGRGHSLGI